MTIQWVNHACYVLEHEDLRIICDPWMEGRVFNESWAHLAETAFAYEDFRDITHIWFSHEHPDHFFPPNLQKIPEESRKNITVLYQETIDAKVVHFCAKLGFKEIIALKRLTEYRLSDEVTVINGKVKNDTDSWLYIKTPSFTILNVNDCVFEPSELEALSRQFGKVDVLFTQFSYASWVGNREDVAAKTAAADGKLQEIASHVRAFEPTFTVPFASFVWFCHEDNFHANAQANDVEKAARFIEELGSKAVVLYPGDKWGLGEEHDSAAAVAKYGEDLKTLDQRELTKFATVSVEALRQNVAKFVEKALSRNNRRKLKSYKPMRVYLTDHDKTFEVSYKDGLREVSLPKNQADIAFHSQNLSYCLNFDWGFDTILVAGTFEKPPGGDFQRFMEYQWVASLNNNGKTMKGIIGRTRDRLIAKLVG